MARHWFQGRKGGVNDHPSKKTRIRPRSRRSSTSLRFEKFEPRLLLSATPLISEFMASNSGTLRDGDGNWSDWIEIHNPTDQTIDLAGWRLTDNASNLNKWAFPASAATILEPSERLIVFASDKSNPAYVDPAGYLHTTFALGAGGEYLALVDPSGTVVHEYAPTFPPQVADVSYGLGEDWDAFTFLADNAVARYIMPTATISGWNTRTFNDSAWVSGPSGIGYETSGNDFAPFIQTNINPTNTLPMANTTLYVRYSFEAADASALDKLTFRVRFDDGFIAYLNGVKVAENRAPASPAWNSAATADHHDSLAVEWYEFDLSGSLGLLVDGNNVLAIHSLNRYTTSSDLLIQAELEGARSGVVLEDVVGYMTIPTPGMPNIMSGPLITNVTDKPGVLAPSDNLVVTASVTDNGNGIAAVLLHYRVDYGTEYVVTMLDNGLDADAVAGDGIFTAATNSAHYGAGDMLRWYVTAEDDVALVSRAPVVADLTGQDQSPEYHGTMILDTSVVTQLDVLYWFVQDPTAAGTDAGTRASLFYLDEFYDNIFVRRRGDTSANWTKRNYKFDFNNDHEFKYSEVFERVEEFNLQSTYSDKSNVRLVLAAETFRDAGAPYGEAFPLRVQQNGAFFSVAIFVEQPDETYLERNGLDKNGALYKMFNSFTSSTAGVEKQTRLDEDNSDLQALIDGLALGNPNQATYLFDHVDLPAVLNHLAVQSLIHNNDHVGKNYYLYRDSEGTELWQLVPWDLDLTLGRNFNSGGVLNDTMWAAIDPYGHPLFGDNEHRKYGNSIWNRFIDAVYNDATVREMYLRRLRTLMDELLQTSATPYAERYYEQRIDELYAQMQPDTDLDYAKWSQYGTPQTQITAINILKNEYLAPRRTHLYTNHATNTSYPDFAGIPSAQVGNPTILFGTVEFNPSSGDQNQEYIQFTNPNAFAVDISNWTLSGGIQFQFAPGTVIPAGGSLYLSPDLVAFRARTTGPTAGQKLLVVGNCAGNLSNFGETLTLRAADGSLVDETTYEGDPSQAQLGIRISELNYNPHLPTAAELAIDPTLGAAEDFEFIELINVSDATIDLTGVHFSAGINYTFTGGLIAPGQRIVLAGNPTAFAVRYDTTGLALFGPYDSGRLDNGGEQIKLDDATGSTIFDFTYSDSGVWPTRADGVGSTLVMHDPEADPKIAASWRASIRVGGTPGAAPETPTVLVNEVVSHTDPPLSDTIELVNTTNQTVHFDRWFLSDSDGNFLKFEIADRVGSLAPGAYVTFNESDFNTGGENAFGLSGAYGETIWLVEVDENGDALRFWDEFAFGPTTNAMSVGRWPNADPDGISYPMRSLTLGGPNSGPYVGTLQFSEVHYNPGTMPEADMLEFIELVNHSNTLISLGGWRIGDGVSYAFDPGQTVAAGGTVVIVPFDPADTAARTAFLTYYGLSGTINLAGPYVGKLDNGGETLRLELADEPPLEDPTYTPWVLIDAVTYDDVTPWPVEADGSGASLHRKASVAWAHDPTNWQAALPTPGTTSVYVPIPGDATLDGTVDQADSVRMAGNWGKGGFGWAGGDFDGDGVVGARDAAILAAHWGMVYVSPAAESIEPAPVEPALVEPALIGPLPADSSGATRRLVVPARRTNSGVEGYHPLFDRPAYVEKVLDEAPDQQVASLFGEPEMGPFSRLSDEAAAVDAALADDSPMDESMTPNEVPPVDLQPARLAWSHVLARRTTATRQSDPIAARPVTIGPSLPTDRR
ncbi:MAG TPA: hypothetical protein DD670_17170 [Planctomycetaceae bacterium]|nr:hypothetical protein [Planctomycetaceae bacterium]